ncbi:pyridoxal phosphate-dependent transferase [Roridomyces roridus]|uniref:Pyridoxal phosphate-dependent transferase n=1 Tax=Roridomyces roridus TaxID=1738132 RepID=A0AAD7B585_9AGAR|nr:pyridoxal phosphate-dependent transferase [Roridomyces roridus]
MPPPSLSTSEEHGILDFRTNDYLSLSQSTELRRLFLDRVQTAPALFGSGSSRLAVNPKELAELEHRLARFFNAPDALVVGSGHDANVAFFRHVPAVGDIMIHDEHVHASIWDGMRSSRGVRLVSFSHNDLVDFRRKLVSVVQGDSTVAAGTTSVFLAVESIYSMDGSIAPLKHMVDFLDEKLPKGNGHLVVDEAHATGVYGPQGRGIVAMYGLEHRCLARLHTFGKAVTSTGAVLLVSPVLREYLATHARVLIFTTAPNHTAIISVDCASDILESSTGTHLASHLLDLCTHLMQLLVIKLANIPSHILTLPAHFHLPVSTDVDELPGTTLPTPIIPLLTPFAEELSAFLETDKTRVRVCLNANKTRKDVARLVDAIIDWATVVVEKKVVGTKL